MSVLWVYRAALDAGEEDRWLPAAQRLAEAIRGADGALWVDVLRSTLDPEIVTVVAEWRTPDMLRAFADSGTAEAFSTAVDPFLREDATARTFIADARSTLPD